MTGKRNLENRIDSLEQESESDEMGMTVAYSTPGTDELTDRNGNPIDRDEISGLLLILNQSFVMSRERAEREGRTILGSAEDAADDAVEVPIDDDGVSY